MNVTRSASKTPTPPASFDVSARGAMQIAVLVEQMRREGFEVLVSRPMVIMKRIDDVICASRLKPSTSTYAR
jgi:GTP-binding protein